MTNPGDSYPAAKKAARAEARRLRKQRLEELEHVDVKIDRLVEGGLGLGFFEKIPILVPRSAPGDVVRAKLIDKQPDYARGEVDQILAPADLRVSAPCPLYTECGGCDIQHIESARQGELKVRAALETLRRIGGLENLQHSLVEGDGLGYRGRAQLQVRGEGNELDIGFFARGSHDLVPTLRCPILTPELEAWLPQVLATLRQVSSPPTRLDLLAGDDGTLSVAPVVEGLPHGAVSRRIGDFTYEVDARCFFQSHSSLVPQLVDLAVGDLEGEVVVELHAGVGLFTLPLSRRYGRVFVAESDRVAVRYLRRNAKKHRIDNLEISATTAEHAAESWSTGESQAAFRGADRWLLDPPRSGLTRKLVAQLSRFRPERVTYVSCQVPTLARDLSKLDWIYEVEQVTFLDLFPQTAHLEAVVQLKRREVLKQRKLEDPEPSRVRSRAREAGGGGRSEGFQRRPPEGGRRDDRRPGRGPRRDGGAPRGSGSGRGGGPDRGGPRRGGGWRGQDGPPGRGRGPGRDGGPGGPGRGRRDEGPSGNRGPNRGGRPDADGAPSPRKRDDNRGPDQRRDSETRSRPPGDRRPKLGGGWGGGPQNGPTRSGGKGDPRGTGGRTPRRRKEGSDDSRTRPPQGHPRSKDDPEDET